MFRFISFINENYNIGTKYLEDELLAVRNYLDFLIEIKPFIPITDFVIFKQILDIHINKKYDTDYVEAFIETILRTHENHNSITNKYFDIEKIVLDKLEELEHNQNENFENEE